MNYKLNDKHFKYFISRCEYWKHKLCIQFEVEYCRIPGPQVRACVQYSVGNANATIKLAHKWEVEPTNEQLDITALHEILHLLLGTMSDAMVKFYANDYSISLEHAVINSLINILEK